LCLGFVFTLENYETALESGSFDKKWITHDPNGGTGNGYFANGVPAPVLTFDLGQLHQLSDVVIWGYASGTNNDAKSLELELSADGGQTYSSPIALIKPRVTEANGHTLPLGGTFATNFVRMTITDNYFGEAGDAGGDRVGLDEVRFLAAPTDQSGVIRPQSAGFDIGAFEAQRPTVQLFGSGQSRGESGSNVVTVTASTDVPVLSTQSVDLAVTGDGITASDYTLTGTKITIPSGGTSASVTFTVQDDDVVERPVETALLTISNPSAGIDLGTIVSRALTRA